MNIVVQISMYLFAEDFKVPILSFIEKLNSYPELQISTSVTSTLVSGDYEHVMQVLKEMLAWSYIEYGRAVYVAKFIPGMSAE
jgi:uncharacterized protein YqgV (UPF0045/DUF77 family)